MFHWVGLIFSLIDEFFFNVAALVNYTERVKVVIKFNNSSNYHKYLYVVQIEELQFLWITFKVSIKRDWATWK